ncbi:MAG: hypothetical protein HYZ44_00490 [Bacteroidetes bacterium]|nr:hypothetical protein [Bacteroidota bacterium]
MLIFKHQQHLVGLFFKSNRLLFVFLLCSSFVYAQSDSLHRLKVQLVLHPEDDSIRVQLLNSVSHLYQYENFHESIEYAEQALKIAQTIHYPKGIATSYYRISICLWALGFHESSINKALLAIQLSEKDHLTNELSESYRVLAMNYRDQQSIEKASYYIQESERLALTLKNWDLLSRIYNTYGLIESDKKNHEISLQLFRKALQITQEHSTYPFHICQILSNIGEYHLQHNADTALTYFSNALAKARESGNRLAEAGITCDIGRTLTKQKKYKEADDYLHRGLALSYRLGLKRVTRHAYNALVELKTQEGKLAESFTYLKSYYDIRDSLLNATKTRQIVELEARFANEKIDQKIRILEKEKQVEAMWRNFLLVGSLFLLISIVVIYRLQQLRSKKTKQLLATQEKLTAQLQETDALKSRFFANISHEFRTPLSLIIAPIEDKINSPGISDHEAKILPNFMTKLWCLLFQEPNNLDNF